jgi:hypothetical protein
MYLSAERLALANQTVQETFEQTSNAWQAIPHWDTGDPGQTHVRSDSTFAAVVAGVEPPLGGETLEITATVVRFAIRVAQAIAPTPDALLAAVIARTEHLARAVDNDVIDAIVAKFPLAGFPPATKAEDLLAELVDARMDVEDEGYLAPSCLLADKASVKILSTLIDGIPATAYLQAVPNIYSLHRFQQLDDTSAVPPPTANLLLLGRRQRIAQGGAATASAGEEPVDLAVSVPPSLEVVGESGDGNIELAVRIRYATRVKDEKGVVVVAP